MRYQTVEATVSVAQIDLIGIRHPRRVAVPTFNLVKILSSRPSRPIQNRSAETVPPPLLDSGLFWWGPAVG